MIQVVTKQMFIDAFEKAGRKCHFSPEGLDLLFDFLEDIHDFSDDPYELDVIELCCDFSEDKLDTILRNHGMKTVEDLEDLTSVIETGDDYIIYKVF